MSTNKEFIERLLKYKNVLINLKKIGIVKVFSDNIGDATGLTSSQVRKDFSVLKIRGNKRGGYQIDNLISDLNAILGKDKPQKVIVAGCGKIGRALIEYNGFHAGNIEIVAGFDTTAEKVGDSESVPIYYLDEMEDFIRENDVKVGIIAVPETAATDVYEKMLSSGIKGVLNFARVHLREAEGTTVSNVNIELQIENLFYFVNILEKKQK